MIKLSPCLTILAVSLFAKTVNGGYIFSAPQVLLAGSTENVCLSLVDTPAGDVNLHLMLVDQQVTMTEQDFIFTSGESRCVGLSIPLTLSREDRHMNLWVTGISQSYNFSGSTPVIVRHDPKITFIQTDKPIYKPGQTVKFRILTVDVNLKPRLHPVDEIVIVDPNGVRLRQWNDMVGPSGLVSLELELSSEPVLGRWKIEVFINHVRQTQTFIVEEYVLPKFEVTIKPMPYLTADSPTISGEICARYTYGKKVQGQMVVQTCIRSPRLSAVDLETQPPCEIVKDKLEGCQRFSVNSKAVHLGSPDYPLWDARLYINASVTETATGITQYGTSYSVKVVQEALKIDFSKSSKFFKPGLPYKGRIRVHFPNGAVAMNEPIKVAAVDYDSGVRAEDVFTSDKHGMIHFVLPGELLLNSKTVTLLAESTRYDDSGDLDYEDTHLMYKPTAIVRLQAWYSRSNSFVQISPIEGTVKCGELLTVGVTYTTFPGSSLTFQYQVVSRGNIVASGQKTHHFVIPSFDPVFESQILTLQNFTETFLAGDPIPVGKDYLNFLFAGQEGAEGPGFEDPWGPGSVDPGFGSPVQEPLIVPEHFEPRGKIPRRQHSDDYDDREPVVEDFIQPEHYEPLGKKKPSTENTGDETYDDRQPVVEDFIQPEHYESLGKKKPSTGNDRNNEFENREPLIEDFIQPKHYEPLSEKKSSTGNTGEEIQPAQEEFIQPKYYEPLGAQGPPLHSDGDLGFQRRKRQATPEKLPKGDPFDFEDKDDLEDVLKEEEMRYEQSILVSYLQLNIPVTADMSPGSRLLVYYVRPDGEMVADGTPFKVKRCFENKVDIKFKKAKMRPGKKTSLTVKADSGSLCGIGVVDKSVHLAGGDNQITLDKIFRQLKKYDIGKRGIGGDENELYCRNKLNMLKVDYGSPGTMEHANPRKLAHGFPGLGPLLRHKRQSQLPGKNKYTSYYVDSIQAFKAAGLVTLTDLDVETRPCEERELDGDGYWRFGDLQRLPGPGGPLPDSLAAAIDDKGFDFDDILDEAVGKSEEEAYTRMYFPETWLWDLISIGPSGEGVLNQAIPDTITQWVGGAVCTHPKSGVGVSSQAVVTTFRPFFVSFTLPYSVVRGERIPVLVTAFNYMPDCLEIKLTLKRSRHFKLSEENEATLCVCGETSDSHRFFIVPKRLGYTNITVYARTVTPSGVCSNDVLLSTKGVGVRDRLTQKLLVQAEGIPQDYTYNTMVCPRDQPSGVFTDKVILNLPPNVIPGSARALFSITGDLMGPTLSGLDKLIQLPTGCGEQNMLNFAPNIYVLQYLMGTRQLLPHMEEKAKGFLRAGYQRELTYRHRDGSYSAFGESDEMGSMWLTAFVVKSFAQAQPLIYMDDEDLVRSLDWFRLRQQENGCFPRVGTVLHKEMKGGLDQSGQGLATITAYVLIAMLETNTPREHQSVQRALRCLENHNITDAYTIALASYALTLYDVNSIIRLTMMNKLYDAAIFEDGLMHWERKSIPVTFGNSSWVRPYGQAASAEVEMTAYALLAYITGNQPNSIMLARPIVHWLTKQRNANGGFTSTQDTVVALQALALYSTLAYHDNNNVTCTVTGTKFSKKYRVNDSNKLLLFSDTIRRLPNKLKVSAVGPGCAIIQANVRYNVKEEKQDKPAFDVFVYVFRSKSDINDCKKRTISICVRYTGADRVSNMVIVAVKMVTGWSPLIDTVQQLTGQLSLGMKRFEVDNDILNLYFEEMTANKRCFDFEVYQDIRVSSLKDAHLTVYDYYETGQTMTVPYIIKTTCGTKEELPFDLTDRVETVAQLPVDSAPPGEETRVGAVPEFDNFDDPFFIEQRRVQPVLPPFLAKKLKEAKEKEKQAEKVQCPVCVSKRPEDFHQRFCAANNAYKTYTGRVGKYPLKIQADFRPARAKKVISKGFAKFTLNPACQCEVLHKKGRAMVLAPQGSYRAEVLSLTDRVTILPISALIERESRKLASSCPSP